MSPDLRVVVYPPDEQGGRRVRCDGEILGRALGPGDLLEFLRRAGLDPDTVRLDDPLLDRVARRRAGHLEPGPRRGLSACFCPGSVSGTSSLWPLCAQ
ncbi:hypothetical protein [Streptomyces xanthophaeus]|uniref:hypothetical protein n=1 Tax=Streptomyces xanthophaeus TaxID=67385 RepID=UPI00372198F4